MTIGTVIVEVPEELSTAEVNDLVRNGVEATPLGRTLSVVFPLPNRWAVSTPFEATIIDAVLGEPSRRDESSQWLFSGNLGIRVCRVKRDGRDVVSELGVLMFRRVGQKVYERRHELPGNIVEASYIDTGHPVFTRDVANNVWHLRLGSYKSELRCRLSMLLSWSDERTLILLPSSRTTVAHGSAKLSLSLIGVPQKSPYKWKS